MGKERDQSGGDVAPSKRPSRKHRRRPSNLLQEYNRRQGDKVWLETHIWHAKRFHMETRWGYRLASHPNDKSWRACYRASATKCLMQDVSCVSVVQLVGQQEVMVEKLGLVTSGDTCRVFGSARELGGQYEGHAVVYRPGQYPRGAIGEVGYLWRPGLEGKVRTLWISIPAACYGEFLETLVEVFAFVRIDKTGDSEAGS